MADKYISAVRFNSDYGVFKKGEVYNFSKGRTDVYGPFGSGKSTFLKAIYESVASPNGPCDIQYGLDDKGRRIDNGVIFISFQHSKPVVEGYCGSHDFISDLESMADNNDRVGIINYLANSVEGCLVILDEPQLSLYTLQCISLTHICDVHYRSRYVVSHKTSGCQLIVASPGDQGWRLNHGISVGNKCWVNDKHIRCARKLENLTTPLPFNVVSDGFVVKIDSRVSYDRPHGVKYFYLAGNNQLVIDPTNAYVYKSKTNAEAAIEAMRSHRWDIECRWDHMGSLFSVRGLRGLAQNSFEIITAAEHKDYVFNNERDQ
jgi:hypothetical protein